jgi:hypothetical protein
MIENYFVILVTHLKSLVGNIVGMTHAIFKIETNVVMNQVGNSNFPPNVHLIFFSTNIRNENNTREIQKWPRARDRT